MQDATIVTALDKAAALAVPIFRLNAWTWGDSKTPPTQDEIAGVFSSLAWNLRDSYGWTGDGRNHSAATGRLLVTMDANGLIRYGIQLGMDH